MIQQSLPDSWLPHRQSIPVNELFLETYFQTYVDQIPKGVDLVFESLRSHTPNPNESIEPKISTPAESRSPSILQQIESSSGLNESKENTLPVSLAAGEQHLPIPMESQPAPAPILLDSEQIGIAPLDSDLDFGLSENKAFGKPSFFSRYIHVHVIIRRTATIQRQRQRVSGNPAEYSHLKS